jgi:hypothetical protein
LGVEHYRESWNIYSSGVNGQQVLDSISDDGTVHGELTRAK